MSDTGPALTEAPLPRFASRGKAFVYVLPCRDRDLLKVGFARDPLRRFMDLHRRFHAFFDLERGLLVAVEKVTQARAIERALLTRFAEARAAAPLEVRDVAAGKTEWYQGIDPSASHHAAMLAEEGGHEVIAPLRAWLAGRLGEHTDRVYDWATRMYEAIVEAQAYGVPAERAEASLALAIERYESVGIRARELVPDDVVQWYERHYRSLA
ncbi:GIY-YIG nuclease family protein [Luteibacter aegosomatis]|uniref:GIY-YIG nuclease family protein n=1 Tax=Luteibacter aegosomatis TaxID=2911537 RepID=UPI001FFB35B1|nr:GIY-YIG nuclease family protein [Luteibacter aegosomatis]UPG85615.1 GIY-YIG nuclease family protein [Luteibacter aegosomatis]